MTAIRAVHTRQWNWMRLVLEQPVTQRLGRWLALLALVSLIGLAIQLIHHSIDLSLALTAYLPVVVMTGMWLNFFEVALVVISSVCSAEIIFNNPLERHWSLLQRGEGRAVLAYSLVAITCALLAMRSRRQQQIMAWADAAIEANLLRMELIASVGQTISAPVQSIEEQAQILQHEGLEGSHYRRRMALTALLGHTTALCGLVENLVQTARIGDGPMPMERSRIELSTLVQSVAQEFQAKTPSHQCRLLVEAGEMPVFGDAVLLRRMVLNLLETATNATGSNAPITVTLRLRNGTLEMSIAGRASALVQAEGERLLNLSGATNAANVAPNRSSGLGVALCRGIAEAHGGRLSAETDQRHGSVFQVSLPLYGGNGESMTGPR